MGLYPTPLAENNSPSVPYNGPNVSQYGWTEQETGYYVQLLEYVEKCEDILDECEEIRDNLGSQGDLIGDMYQEILLIKQEMDEMVEDFAEDLADFETKYNDFLAKYAQIVDVYDEMMALYQGTVDAAAQAASSASTAIDAATEAEGYAQTALGYAQAADFDAKFASDEADRAQGYAEMLEHPYEDMGTHTIMQGYPAIPAFSSMWYITDGGIDPNDPNVLWSAGDMLLYSKREGLWSRLTGQALGGGGQVPIEILGDLIMQQGTKIRFRIDEFNDTTGMSLDGDGDLVVGEIPEGANQSAPAEKIGLAARELYNIYGTDSEGGLVTYRIYDQNFKPTPTEIGAVRRNGDTMTGTLVAPTVKVVASPSAVEDLTNKGYVDGIAGSKTYFGETPPVGAAVGSMWYCTGNGLTYIHYNDGNSTQWIEANPNYPAAIGDHDHDKYVAIDGSTTMSGDLKLDAKDIVVLSTTTNAARGTTFKNADGTDNGGYGWEWNATDKTNGGFHVGPYKSGYASADGYFRAKAGGQLFANGANRIYHQGFKPTASDIGAAAASHTHNPSEVGAVAKTGDTMTGDLHINKASGGLVTLDHDPNQIAFIQGHDGTKRTLFMGVAAADGTVQLSNASGVYLNLYEDRAAFSHRVQASPPIDAADLTRKDYVDNNFLRLSGSNKMTGTLMVDPGVGGNHIDLFGDMNAAAGNARGVFWWNSAGTERKGGTGWYTDSNTDSGHFFFGKGSSPWANWGMRIRDDKTAIDSNAGRPVSLEGSNPTLQLFETDTSKKYLLIGDGSNVRFQEDTSAGPTVWSYTAASKYLDVAALSVRGQHADDNRPAGQNGWAPNIYGAGGTSIAIALDVIPAGGNQTPGFGVNANGNIYFWTSDGTKNYALTVDNAVADFSRTVTQSTPQGTAANCLTRKDYVDSVASKPVVGGDGAAGTTLTFDITGKTMACVELLHGGKLYPLTFPLIGTGFMDHWIRNRGGDTASNDYDFGVKLTRNGASSTLTSIQGSGAPGLPGMNRVYCW